MESTRVDSGSFKPPEASNPPKKKQHESAAPTKKASKKQEWDLQESRGRSSRNKRISKRSEDPEIQERSSWWKHGCIPPSEWKRLDEATGELNWIGHSEPKQTTPGSQRWWKKKELDQLVEEKAKSLEENWRMLFDAQMQFRQLSEGTNQAQTSTFQTLKMREYAVSTHEDYWRQMTYQQLSATNQQTASASSWSGPAPASSFPPKSWARKHRTCVRSPTASSYSTDSPIPCTN